MFKRYQTKKIKIGNISLGGNNEVLIQTMCDIKTSHIKSVVKQIKKCEELGCNLIRVSVLDIKDAKAIKQIKKQISIPLIADIHFNYKLALLAINNGADKIRINPGNIKNKAQLIEIIEAAKKNNVAIRIGVNQGSILDKKVIDEKTLVNLAIKYVHFFEKHNFHNIVISLKSSDPIKTYKSYMLISQKTSYPLHIGVTESGFDENGIIRSLSAIAPLLMNGIGNTIRISLSKDPFKEVLTARKLLNDLNLRHDLPTIISCPTCGRCEVSNTKNIAKKIEKYLMEHKINITVSIMGCIVNGIGEGKESDIGLAGGKNCYIIFKKGITIKKTSKKDVYY